MSSSTTEYVLMQLPTARELTEVVGSMLQDGWKLHGDAFFAEENYTQALVRHQPNFTVVTAGSADGLGREVREYLRRGWSVVGPMTIERINSIPHFFQPLNYP